MSTTSKKYFDKKFKNDIWSDFSSVIKKAKTGEELCGTFDKYLPPQEKIMLEKRLGVIYLAGKGIGSREISRQIDVTLKTISFIKKGFKPPIKRNQKKNITAATMKISNRAPNKKFKLKYKGVSI